MLQKDSQGEWFKAGNSKPPAKVIKKITGSSAQPSKVKAAAVKPKSWHFFAGRFDPDTSSDEVFNYMVDAGIHASSCEPVKRTEKWQEKFAAFRIVVDLKDKDALFQDTFWPAGVEVRAWRFKSSA
jgi:cellulase/cellobiase CelA1